MLREIASRNGFGDGRDGSPSGSCILFSSEFEADPTNDLNARGREVDAGISSPGFPGSRYIRR